MRFVKNKSMFHNQTYRTPMKKFCLTSVFAFALVFVLSCNKSLVEPTLQTQDQSITVQEAQAYYSSNNASSAARQQADPIEFKNVERTPKWDKAIQKVAGGQQVGP